MAFKARLMVLKPFEKEANIIVCFHVLQLTQQFMPVFTVILV